jgi:hypothetical protein
MFAASMIGRVPVAYSDANLVANALYLVVTLLLYDIFKAVNRNLAVFAVAIGVVGCVVQSLSLFHLTPPLSSLPIFGCFNLVAVAAPDGGERPALERTDHRHRRRLETETVTLGGGFPFSRAEKTAGILGNDDTSSNDDEGVARRGPRSFEGGPRAASLRGERPLVVAVKP